MNSVFVVPFYSFVCAWINVKLQIGDVTEWNKCLKCLLNAWIVGTQLNRFSGIFLFLFSLFVKNDHIKNSERESFVMAQSLFNTHVNRGGVVCVCVCVFFVVVFII